MTEAYHGLEIHDLTGMVFLGFVIGVVCVIGCRLLFSVSLWGFFGVSEGSNFITQVVRDINGYRRVLISALGGLFLGVPASTPGGPRPSWGY